MLLTRFVKALSQNKMDKPYRFLRKVFIAQITQIAHKKAVKTPKILLSILMNPFFLGFLR